MERNPANSTPREQSLQQPEAKLTRKPVVTPVSLERRDVSMQQSSGADQPKSITDTSTTATGSSSSSKSSSRQAITSGSTSMVAQAEVIALTSAPAAQVVAASETAEVVEPPLVSSSVIAVASAPAPPSSKQHEKYLLQRQLQLDTPAVAAALTPVTVTATATNPVGGKRPQADESPVIILTQHHDDDIRHDDDDHEDEDETKKQTDLSESSTTKSTKQQELAQLQSQKPDESTSQVSTPEPPGDRGRELERRAGRSGVHFSTSPPARRDTAHVMEFFQEQEKNLQESFLSLPKRAPRKQRSPSPNWQQSVGLEHLDNLIKLMEQLTTLKDENSRLRKRCDYLESTKVLLQAKQDLSFESSSSSSGFITLSTSKHKHQPRHHSHPRPSHHRDHDRKRVGDLARLTTTSGNGGSSPSMSRPRLPSAEGIDYLEMIDSSSDQRPRRTKHTLHKRSFSTGSLEVPSEILQEVEKRKRLKAKSRSIFGGKHSSSKQKSSSKSSKWARVKKVLTGQKLYEDLGTTIRSLRDLGKSTNIRYSTGGSPTRHHEATSPTHPRPQTEPHIPLEGRGSPETVFDPGPPISQSHKGPPRSHSIGVSTVTRPDQDLSGEIWMGPPDWWDEYNAQRESGTSTASDVSSVIEVTTMYIGAKKDDVSPGATDDTTLLGEVGGAVGGAVGGTSSEDSAPTSPSSPPEKFLKVGSLPRRQSSPSLGIQGDPDVEDEDLLEDLTITSETTSRILHKSSSCKSADLELSKELSLSMSPKSVESRVSKKFHRTAWGKVKDIIHTRKDSVKKKQKRDKSGIESEEASEIDVEGLMEETRISDSFAEGLLSRSTPKTSPVVIRQQTSKSISESPPGPAGAISKTSPSRSSYQMGSSPGNVDVAALAGSMDDEFKRKMQEWEKKQAERSRAVRTSIEDSELDSSVTSTEYAVKTVDLRDLRGKVPADSTSETPEESHTSLEVMGAPSINVEEIQRRMTGSFSRKMQEWERIKYKGSPSSQREPSPDIERKGSKGREKERQKSKRSKEEKEKERLERQRERDKQKVEREQVKLEKEKLRIEKERLRALEREAKLEKLKGRLSQAEVDTAGMRNPVLSPLAEYKVTADFARKLHEWELRKGLSHDVSNSIYLEAQKMSMQHLRQTGQQLEPLSKPDPAPYVVTPDSGASSTPASPPPPLSISSFWDSPEERSPIEKESEVSLVDDDQDQESTVTSLTEECLTKSNIASLERANTQLVEELQKKEKEYAAVQEEVTKVNEKLAKVREEHATEMARFHRELAQGAFTGPVKLEVGELETTVGDLEEKIKIMENFGEKLALSMESAAVGKWQSIEGEETVHTQLVELVDQMRSMLVQATQSEEQSQKTMALSTFETCYSQAMKLQVQMNNLRLSHLERNREIMQIKRQLLLQEVNNLLLQADITRRETELYQFHEARKFASLKRWNTFSGAERQRPHAQVETASSAAKYSKHRETLSKVGEPRPNIPYIAEDVSQTTSTSSLSAPASPSVITASGGAVSTPTSSQSHSNTATSRERSTDHVETYLQTPPLERRMRDTCPPTDQKSAPSRRQDTGARPTLQIPPTTHTKSTGLTSTEASSLSPSLSPSSLSPTSPESPAPSSASFQTVIAKPLVKTPKTEPSPESVQVPRDLQQKEDSPTPGGHKGSSTSGVSTDAPFIRPPTTKAEIVTFCDSAPLLREIEELKRAKSKVERGSPTLKKKKGGGPSPVPSPGKDLRHGSSTTETPEPTIPKQQSHEKPRLVKAASIEDEDYSPAPAVIKCTESGITSAQLTPEQKPGAGAGGVSIASHQLPPVADTTRRDLPPTSEPCRAGSKSPRSPASKQKLLRRQREERDTKLKDYRAISPKGSPVAARGKPPLPIPRSPTPQRQSPSASASDKGPRSKSVGDMEPPTTPDSPSIKPLHDAINKFEKRATVCETEDNPVEQLRKTPSPTLHLPRVGLVTRVRRLKPAAELLEESQRYRSGHSIYATRILQRYLPKDDRAKPGQSPNLHNKENVSSTYVNAIVQRLSRETTPVKSGTSSRRNSNISLQRIESPRPIHSDLVSGIVRKLSSGSSQDIPKSSGPLKDLTNGSKVKKLTKTFDGHPTKDSPERTLSDTNINIDRGRDPPDVSAFKTQNRNSCEVAMVMKQCPSSEASLSFDVVSTLSVASEETPRTRIVSEPTNHQSLPSLVTPGSPPVVTSAQVGGRGRAATYCASETVTGRSRGHTKSEGTGKAGTSLSPARSTDKRPGKSGKKGESRFLSSSLSPDRRGKGRGKMGTVGVLCKQSMSFDLGVSLYAQKSQDDDSSQKSRKPRSWDPSESAKIEAEAEAAAAAAEAAEAAEISVISSDFEMSSSVFASSSAASPAETRSVAGRPVSSGSEGEMAPSSPGAEERKKSRRFLDSSWLQKSKRFFKVSK